MSLEVTRIHPARRKNWFVVEFEDGQQLKVSASGLAKFRLAVGKKIESDQVDQIRHYTDFFKVYERAVRFLSYRPRSVKEVQDRIHQKESVSSALVDEVINRLTKEELVNDERFARWWCEQRGRFRPRSKRLLLAELWQKGVEPKLAQRVVDELVDEEVLVEKILVKKYTSSLRTLQGRQKIIQALGRLGFDWELVKKVVARESGKELV